MDTYNNYQDELKKKNDKDHFDKKENEKKQFLAEMIAYGVYYSNVIHESFMGYTNQLKKSLEIYEKKRLQERSEEEKYLLIETNNAANQRSFNETIYIRELENELTRLEYNINKVIQEIELLKNELNTLCHEKDNLIKNISDTIKNLNIDPLDLNQDKILLRVPSSQRNLPGAERFQANIKFDKEFYNKVFKSISDSVANKEISLGQLNDGSCIREAVEKIVKEEIILQYQKMIPRPDQKKCEEMASEVIKQPQWQNRITHMASQVKKCIVKSHSIGSNIKLYNEKERMKKVLEIKLAQAEIKLFEQEKEYAELDKQRRVMKSDSLSHISNTEKSRIDSMPSNTKLSISILQDKDNPHYNEGIITKQALIYYEMTETSLKHIEDCANESIEKLKDSSTPSVLTGQCEKDMGKIVSSYHDSMESSFANFINSFSSSSEKNVEIEPAPIHKPTR